MEWWQRAVVLQIYPRSYQDSDGDGVGDLRGLCSRLEYLEWLGVDALWLSPTFPSPNDDWGYDVADYRGVHPELGTLEDMDALLAEAEARGIRVLLDLVPNHTSEQHPWFRGEHRDWYVWADPAPDGGPPNNWRSVFGGSAWEWSEPDGRFYLHNFLRSMPDLDWWNEGVRAEFEDVLRFWFDRGVAGFRIDVAHGLVHDRQLRDNSPAEPGDSATLQRMGQRLDRSLNQPEVHDVYRAWRRLADGYEPSRALLGETYVMELERLASFYGTGRDELHLAFNFTFLHADLDADVLRDCVERTEAALPDGAWPVWTSSNHDVERFPSRWADGDERRARGRAADAADAPRDAGPLLRRRAPAPERRGARRGVARPGRGHGRPRARPGRRADADAVGAGAGVRVHDGRAVAPDRRPRRADGRRAAGRRGLGAAPSPATSSRSGARARTS